MALKINVTQKNAFAETITLSGVLDNDSSPKLDIRINQSLAGGTKMLVMDLANLTLITSSGIGIMTKAKASLTKRGGDLAMINLQPQIKKVFDVVRLVPVLNVFESTEELDNYLVVIQKKIIDDE
ncbi:MAG: STAS domain-containing protein [Planctomycetota bacterium]|jgi:anti-anti-sigma factor